jgi:hypothetical protein
MRVIHFGLKQSTWLATIATASIIIPIMEKTPYELLNGRKPNIAYEFLDANAIY